MKVSDSGIGLIERREGVRLQTYRDAAGLPTIGVGHLLTKDELRSGKIAGIGSWTVGISPRQADQLLHQDLAAAEAALTAVTVPLSPQQYDTLVSFVFNVGVGTPRQPGPGTGFLGSRLLVLLNAGQYDAVPAQLKRWIYSAGQVDPILVKRRADEIRQWNEPLSPSV